MLPLARGCPFGVSQRLEFFRQHITVLKPCKFQGLLLVYLNDLAPNSLYWPYSRLLTVYL